MQRIPDFIGPIKFIRQLGKHRPVRWRLALLFLLKVSFTLPGYWIELLFRAKKIKETKISHAPIFVLGHYRSGTTLLHKLLSKHPDWAYIKGKHFLFPYSSRFYQKCITTLFGWVVPLFNIDNPYYHNYRFRLEDPVEEDNYLIYATSPYSTFWGFIFPKQFEAYLHRHIDSGNEEAKTAWKANYDYLVKKITRMANGKRLVLKNPPNTARIKLLLSLYPDAKFVYIHRNPYAVFASMDFLVKEVIQKNVSLQRLSTEEREAMIFRHYQVLIDAYEESKDLIPDGNLYELSYEQMITDPEVEIKKLLHALKLEGSDKIGPAIQAHLNKEKAYSPKKYHFSDGQMEKITQNWGRTIKKGNYSPPTVKD